MGLNILHTVLQRRRREISSSSSSLVGDLSSSYSSSSLSYSLEHLPEKLLVRQLLLSIHGGNSESAHLLGSHFLHQHTALLFNQSLLDTPSPSPSSPSTPTHPSNLPDHEFPLNYLSELYPTRLTSALYWYSKSSAMGNAFGSFQCGLIHHFGILHNPKNLVRAQRYYELALQQYQQQQQQQQGTNNLQYICEGFLSMIHLSKKYSIMNYLSEYIGWAIRWIFFEG